ncbi:MAG: hypothetical protein KJP14_10065 [Eudoraea sp.]|nr:hypothetical protein [Eudoraea sp.]
MAKLKINWNSERILSLSAMSISFITLVIFIYQTNLMSKQNYLSILPYLQLSTSNDSENNSFTLGIQNYGVGPAIIESVKLQFRGEEYDLRDYDHYLFNFLNAQDLALDSLTHVDNSTLNPGMAIPPNSNYQIFEVTTEQDYKSFLKSFVLLEEDLSWEIKYKSIQDEHWMIHKDSDGPEKLD